MDSLVVTQNEVAAAMSFHERNPDPSESASIKEGAQSKLIELLTAMVMANEVEARVMPNTKAHTLLRAAGVGRTFDVQQRAQTVAQGA